MDSYKVIVMLGAFSWFLSHQAGRLDRLHHRIETAEAALFAQLNRRAAIALELSNSDLVDPATAQLLADEVSECLESADTDWATRGPNESGLTASLSAVTSDLTHEGESQATSPLLAELSRVSHQVQLSRRFHADAVTACLHLRRQFFVRFFRLAGHAQLPTTYDFDDRIPEGL